MQCPLCKNKMEEGFLKSSHPIIWSQEKEFLPLRSDGFKMSRGFWNGCFINASICRQCGILIAHLPDKKEG